MQSALSAYRPAPQIPLMPGPPFLKSSLISRRNFFRPRTTGTDLPDGYSVLEIKKSGRPKSVQTDHPGGALLRHRFLTDRLRRNAICRACKSCRRAGSRRRIGRCSAIPVGAVSGRNQRLIASRPWTKNRRCGCKTDSFAVPDLGKTRAVHFVTGTGNRPPKVVPI